MDRSEAERTLESVTRTRVRTRRLLASDWYARIVIGVFVLGAGVLNAIDPGEAVAWVYWVGGIALGAWMIVAHYARAERQAGIESRPWDASVTLLVLLAVGLVIVNRVTDGNDTAVAISLLTAVATAGFAWISRDPFEAITAAAFAALAVVFALVGPISEPGTPINAAIGAILIAGGFASRARERATRRRGIGSTPARA